VTVHAYALTSITNDYPLIPPEEGVEFGPLFSLRRLFPPLHLQGIYEKFKKREDYGKFAPHIEQTYCELIVDEKKWEDKIVKEGVRFAEVSEEEKIGFINGAVSILLTLINLRGCSLFIVPLMIHNSSFRDLHKVDDSSISAHFFPGQNLIQPMLPPTIPYYLNQEDIEWIMNHHFALGKLFHEGKMEFIIDVFDTMCYPNPKVQLVLIWAAIEAIIKPEKNEAKRTGLRHSIRSRCSMILCDSLEEQGKMYEKIGTLYDLRSDTVHGKDLSLGEIQEDDVIGLVDSFSLLKDLLISIIEKGSIPTKKELGALQKEYENAHY
jgi:hypothetical protein